MNMQICEQSVEVRSCSCCGAEEGKPRLVGDFLVKLQTVVIDNEEQLVCQSCLRKNRIVRETLGLVSFCQGEAKTKTKFKFKLGFLSR
ncbi:MAG: hypothetical protein ED557_07565 [Balneola sp.]|nr:MAG: hypothetical protein ED557_07565 [Balneola sp.]